MQERRSQPTRSPDFETLLHASTCLNPHTHEKKRSSRYQFELIPGDGLAKGCVDQRYTSIPRFKWPRHQPFLDRWSILWLVWAHPETTGFHTSADIRC
jgi:hypothetical protein